MKKQFSVVTTPYALSQTWAVRVGPDYETVVRVMNLDDEGDRYWGIVLTAPTPYSLPDLTVRALALLEEKQKAWNCQWRLENAR